MNFIKKLIHQNTVLKNWSTLVTSSLACQVLGMLAVFRLARILSPEGYGLFSLMQTYASMGMVFAGMGMRMILIREVARQPKDTPLLIIASTLVRIASFFVVIPAILVYSHLAGNVLPTSLLWPVVVLFLAMAGWDLMECAFFGRQKMIWSAALNFSGSLLWCSLAWFTPIQWITPFSITLFYALMQFGETLIYLIVGRELFRFDSSSFRPLLSVIGRLFKMSLPLWWLAILTSFTTQLPILFLAAQSSKGEVGLYNAGNKIIFPFQMLLLNLMAAIYPSISLINRKENPQQYVTIIQQIISGIFLLGSLAAIIISLLRSEIVLFLFGSAYRASSDVIACQVWYTVIYALYCLIGTSLNATDNQKKLSLLSTIYAVFSVPFLWLGARNGAIGLAVTFLGVIILNLTYHWAVFQKSLPFPLSKMFVLVNSAVLFSLMALSFAIPQEWTFPFRLILCFLFLLAFITFLYLVRDNEMIGFSGLTKGLINKYHQATAK